MGMGLAGLGGASGAAEGLRRVLERRMAEAKFAQEQQEAQARQQQETFDQEMRRAGSQRAEAEGRREAELHTLRLQEMQQRLAPAPGMTPLQSLQMMKAEADLMPKPPALEEEYTLSPGQTRFRGRDRLASVADRPQQSEGVRPYFLPLQTGQGIQTYNTRTGQTEGRIGDLKPGETAQKEIANAKTIATVTGQVLNSMDAAKIGPLMGRYRTAEAMLTGGDPEFAAFAASIRTLQNTVINLRTGAQMSEPEAQRIMGEVANVNLPPATFIARAKQAQRYFEEWLKNRASVAYGRTTTGDVDQMVGPGAGISDPYLDYQRSPNAR